MSTPARWARASDSSRAPARVSAASRISDSASAMPLCALRLAALANRAVAVHSKAGCQACVGSAPRASSSAVRRIAVPAGSSSPSATARTAAGMGIPARRHAASSSHAPASAIGSPCGSVFAHREGARSLRGVVEVLLRCPNLGRSRDRGPAEPGTAISATATSSSATACAVMLAPPRPSAAHSTARQHRPDRCQSPAGPGPPGSRTALARGRHLPRVPEPARVTAAQPASLR
jgi:hypothetical protein